MEGCIFCKIGKREAPAQIVFENDLILGIIPINQISKGHTLVIPKAHSVNIFDVEDAVLRELIAVTKVLSTQITKENGATGVNILNASGKDAQQSVEHLHFHIVPRYPNDGLDMWIKQNL